MGWRAPDGDAAGGRAASAAGRRARSASETSGATRHSRRGREGRGRRVLKRGALTLIVLILVIAAAIGVLILITPSAGEATQLAQEQSQEHGNAYPGPAVPTTFSIPLVATEDKRFYSESGLDPFAVVRFAWSRVTGNNSDEGGATLQQQLAKLLYTPQQSGPVAEVKQIVLAYKLNDHYSKAQILQMYSEVAYYGHGYYGLEAASCGYFGHPVADLTPVQGAMLAGAVNAPTIDDPIDNPVAAKARLDHVIGRMVAVGDISSAYGQQLMNTSLGVVSRADAGC